jgi:DNA-binding SARP family transcriptional activator
MESPRLRILILGSPVITWDGKPVEISRRLIRLLFYYIASQKTPVTRSHLSQLFWPELDDSQGHKNLRESLSKLRAELPDPNLIIVDDDEVSLDTRKVFIDGREFQALVDPIVTKSTISSGARLPDWMYTNLRKGMGMCRGNHILQDFRLPESGGLEMWLSLSNQAYDYYRMRSLEFLAGHCIAIGNLNEAIDWLGKYAEIDPLNTENNYLTINCLQERGRIKEAADYITYLEKLYRTLSDEELPATISAFRSRLNEYKQPTQEKEGTKWPGRDETPTTFIGREDLLEKLQHAYHRKGIISIKGESGCGKSRLLQEFYENLPVSPRLLFCSGKPLMRCSPFEPLIEGLRSTVTAQEWALLPENVRQNLSRLFPELQGEQEITTDHNHENNSIDDIHAIYSGLYNVLFKLAEKKTLLMVVDIVQWCDEATIDFLSYLSDREFFKKHGLLIISSRREEVNPTVEIFIDRNTMLYTLESIEVPLFTFEETRTLVQGIIGKDCSEKFLEKVFKSTGGNPYFIIEGLNSIQSINFEPDTFADESHYPIPSTIQALVNEKVRLLSANTREVLQSASILGQKFQPKVVEKMVRLKVEELISALEELQNFSILNIEDGMSLDSRYEFPHDQVREVILKEMSPLRKRTLHLKALGALQVVNGEKPELASIYAYHCEQAGELNRAFEYWIKAGQFARSRFSKTDTYYAYRQASSLIPVLQTDNATEFILQLVTEWGDYAYDHSDLESCEHIYGLCYQLGEQSQNPLLLGAGLSGLGRVSGMKLQIAEGIEHLQRACYFLDLAGNKAERFEAAARLGILYSLSGQVNNAKRTYEEALSGMPEPKTQREMDAFVNTQTQLGLIFILAGWPKKAIEVAEHAHNLSQLIKRRSARVQALAVLAAASYYTGEYSQSLKYALSGVAIAERLNLRWWLSLLETVIARDHLVMGNMDQCWVYIQTVIEREKEIVDKAMLRGIYTVLGDVNRFFRNFEEAARVFQLGIDENVEDLETLENTYLLGVARAQSSDSKNGLDLISRAKTIAHEKELELVSLPARMFEFMLNPDLVLDEVQAKNLELTATEIIRRGMGTSHVILDIVKGNLARKEGKLSEAEELFKRMRDFGAKHSHIWIELYGCQYLLDLYPPGSKEHTEYRLKAREVKDKLRERSTLPPLRRLYSNLRKTMEI